MKSKEKEKKKIFYFKDESADDEILYFLTSDLSNRFDFFNVPTDISDKDLLRIVKECLELEYFPILKHLEKARLEALTSTLIDEGINLEVITILINKSS